MRISILLAASPVSSKHLLVPLYLNGVSIPSRSDSDAMRATGRGAHVSRMNPRVEQGRLWCSIKEIHFRVRSGGMLLRKESVKRE